MEYIAKTISDPLELGECEPFPIASFNWGGDYRPRSYGCMGNLDQKGLLIKLVSEEKKPLRDYYRHNHPIYLDSSLCIYLRLGESNNYFGFELNANGALYASYGPDRFNRETFSDMFLQRFHSTSGITLNYWYAVLFLPYEALAEVQEFPRLGKNDVFYCNFYKHKASAPLEHYATWNPVPTETPDFHQPKYFGKVTIA